MKENRFNFRIWDKKNKVFIYDFHIFSEAEDGFMYFDRSSRDYVVEHNNNNDYIINQSTGLTDRNGKEIFEGDIVVDVNDKTRYKVFYREIGACFSLEFLDSEDFDCRDFGEIQHEGIGRNLEVIGNIYENSELLVK